MKPDDKRVGGRAVEVEYQLAQRLTPAQMAALRPDIVLANAAPLDRTAADVAAVVLEAARARGYVS